MRNGDFSPSRMDSQLDAANLIAGAKTGQNPETTVGILTMAGKCPEVHVAPTTNLGKILSCISSIKITGTSNFSNSLKVALLALKKRSTDQSQNSARRIIIFVGSPLKEKQDELESLGAKLKKNNISCDVINFGEEKENTLKLEAFMKNVNSDDNSSSLVTVPSGPHLLSDILLNTTIIGDGQKRTTSGGNEGFDFGGVDENDPELMMALRMSMEEEKRRKEKEKKDNKTEEKKEQPKTQVETKQEIKKEDKMEEEVEEEGEMDEEAMIQEAIRLSMQPAKEEKKEVKRDEKKEESKKVDQMEEYDKDIYDEEEDINEEEALRLAKELSKNQPKEKEESIKDILQDDDFLNSVLQTLPKDEKKDEKKEEKK